MRKWLLAGVIALGVLGSYGVSVLRAGITCTLPFTLQNNTIADATQVMANYNALVTCFTSAAASGVNSDITALAALSTPLTPAQGGSYIYAGGTSTGSGNAQVVASVSPTNFTLAAGKRVTFIAGFSNTAATTLNVSSQGAISVFRRTQLGASASVGGEIVAGQLVEVVYDGTQFQLVGQTYYVGAGMDWFTTTAPAGWLLQDGSSLLRTDYPTLFAVIGTTYGAADGTHFSLPDMNGRMSLGKDGLGRITGVCAGSNTLGTACGNTAGTVAILQANIPNYSLPVTDPGHMHPQNAITVSVTGGNNTASGTNLAHNASVQNTTSNTTGITVASGGSGTALTVLNGVLVVNKIIKY